MANKLDRKFAVLYTLSESRARDKGALFPELLSFPSASAKHLVTQSTPRTRETNFLPRYLINYGTARRSPGRAATRRNLDRARRRSRPRNRPASIMSRARAHACIVIKNSLVRFSFFFFYFIFVRAHDTCMNKFAGRRRRSFLFSRREIFKLQDLYRP